MACNNPCNVCIGGVNYTICCDCKPCRKAGSACNVSNQTVAANPSVNQSVKGSCGGATCLMGVLSTAMKTGSTIATTLVNACLAKKQIAAKAAAAPSSNMTLVIIAIIVVVGIIFLAKKG